MTNSSSASDIGSLASLWMRTARVLGKRVFVSRKKGVNPLQIHAMLFIAEHEHPNMKDLAVHLGITSPSATALVNRLVRLKWVRRSVDSGNRRQIRLSVAKEGRNMLQSQLRQWEGAMRDVLALLSPADRRAFAKVLQSLHNALSGEAQR